MSDSYLSKERVALCTIFTILLTLWNSEQKNGLLIKLFCFSSDFDETWWSCSYPCVLQFHQVSSKSDEKQKSFLNSLFFCSEFQSVSRIVKIVHSGATREFRIRLLSSRMWCPFEKFPHISKHFDSDLKVDPKLCL